MFDKIIRHIIYFLILFIPLENVFLANVGSIPILYISISQLPDLLVLLSLFIVIGQKSIFHRKFIIVGNGVEVLLLLFFLSTLIASLIQGANKIEILLNLKVFFRYLILLYILLNINLSEGAITRFSKLFLWGIIIQNLIALLQLVFGLPIYQIFMGATTTMDVAGREIYSTNFKDYLNGWIIGSQSRSISFALFNLIGFTYYLIILKSRGPKYFLVIGAFLFFLFMSGSRSVFLVTFLSWIGYHFYKNGISRWLAYSILSLPLLLILLIFGIYFIPENYVFHIFSQEYIKEASNQRLGVLLIMLPEFFNASVHEILLGFTPDKDILFNYFKQIPNRPKLLYNKADTIEDVYWIAIIYYYGIVGFTLIIGFLSFIYTKIYHFYKKHNQPKDPWILFSLVLFLQILFLNFFNQVFEVRQYSFFFWLFIGIVLYKLKNPILLNEDTARR